MKKKNNFAVQRRDKTRKKESKFWSILKGQAAEFCRETGFHGYKYISQSQRSKPERYVQILRSQFFVLMRYLVFFNTLTTRRDSDSFDTAIHTVRILEREIIYLQNDFSNDISLLNCTEEKDLNECNKMEISRKLNDDKR